MVLARASCRRSAPPGFHAVAVDLRGYGATDKPPRGYDGYTLAADVAGLVRALGARDALPRRARLGRRPGLDHRDAAPPCRARPGGAVGAAHPLRLRAGAAAPAPQARASAYVAGFQVPRRARGAGCCAGGARAASCWRRWGGPGFPDAETERALPRGDGGAGRGALRAGVLPLGGALAGPAERPALPAAARARRAGARAAAARRARHAACCPSHGRGLRGATRHGGYELRVLAGVGHFPHEEAPDAGAPRRVLTARCEGAAATGSAGRCRSDDPGGGARRARGGAARRPRRSRWRSRCSTRAGAFGAHEVLEASWKAAPADERDAVAGPGAAVRGRDAPAARQRRRRGAAAPARRRQAARGAAVRRRPGARRLGATPSPTRSRRGRRRRSSCRGCGPRRRRASGSPAARSAARGQVVQEPLGHAVQRLPVELADSGGRAVELQHGVGDARAVGGSGRRPA